MKTLFLPLVLLALVFVSLLIFLSLSFRSRLLLSPHSSSLPIALLPSLPPPTPTPEPSAVIGLVGDLGLGRFITANSRAKKDFSWPFAGISPWLLGNDFTFANLESPIIDNCPEGRTGTFTFCGDPRFLPFLKQYKFGFTLANNHILNYGASGLQATQKFLTLYHIPYVYSPSPDSVFSRQTISGLTFGFLGFDLITHPSTDTATLVSFVKQYKAGVDWLIVSLHWGNEYLSTPEPWRVALAHQLIDAGADIIHGSHPHVWQGSETYRGKKIYYSLGNFIFDQNWSYNTSHTQIVRLTLSKTHILKEELFPIEIRANSQPWLVSSAPSPDYLR